MNNRKRGIVSKVLPAGTGRRHFAESILRRTNGIKRLITSGMSDLSQGNLYEIDKAIAAEAETIKGSGLFDRKWYLKQNPDVAHHKIDPLSHFITHGAFEARDPSNKFSILMYKALHPDLVVWKDNLLLHYLENRASDSTRYDHKAFSKYLRDIESDIATSIIRNKRAIVFESMEWFKAMSQRPHHLARLFAEKHITVIYIDRSQPSPIEVNNNLFIVNDGYNIDFKIPNVAKYLWVFSTASYSRNHINNLHSLGYEFIYDYIDDFDESISVEVDKQKALYEYMKQIRPKVLIASAARLVEQLKDDTGRDDIVVAKNAVDLTHFNVHKKYDRREAPADLKPILEKNRPIVGYYGAMAPWLDYDLVNAVTEKESDKEFVFIGIDYRDALKYLQLRDNVHFLGPKDYDQLASYSYWFDCALIPFQKGDIAKSTSPVKLFEYMAMGIPTVCTADLRECYGYDYVYIAKDEQQYIDYINEAIAARKTKEAKRSLEKSAQENTWQARVESVYKHLA